MTFVASLCKSRQKIPEVRRHAADDQGGKYKPSSQRWRQCQYGGRMGKGKRHENLRFFLASYFDSMFLFSAASRCNAPLTRRSERYFCSVAEARPLFRANRHIP